MFHFLMGRYVCVYSLFVSQDYYPYQVIKMQETAHLLLSAIIVSVVHAMPICPCLIDFSGDLQCAICGPHPQAIIMDKTALILKRPWLLERIILGRCHKVPKKGSIVV